MPTVPQYSQRQTVDQGAPAPQVNVQTSPVNFGGGWAELGNNVAGILGEQVKKANVARQQEAIQQFQAFADDQLNNTDTGLMTKTGKNAIGQAEPMLANLRSKADELAQTIPEGLRPQFISQLNEMGMGYRRQALRYEIGQTQQYESDQFQATLSTGVKNASALYNDNQSYVAANKQVFSQIDEFGAAHGWSPEQVQAKKVEFKEATARQAVENQLGASYMDFISQNGEPSDTGGAMRVPSAGGGSGDPRGVRNNNPGNIRATGKPWDGQTGDDGEYAKFATPEHGIRALGRNLLSYNKQGFDTVQEIIGRWAPPNENDTGAYVKTVAAKLGVAPDAQIDLTDINTLSKLSKAIMQHENGQMNYSDAQINSGLQAALGVNSLPPAAGAVKRLTGMSAFDALNADDQGKYLRQAEAMRSQQQTQMRAVLTDQISDAKAAYMKGVEFASPPTQDQLVAAWGYREGTQRFEDLQNQRIAGKYIGSFRTMPTASIQQYVNGMKQNLGNGEGFASRAGAYDHVAAAAKQVISLRESNPYQAALDLGAYKPIASNAPGDITAEVKSRAAATDQLKAIGINAPLLSREEASAISDRVRGTTDVNQSLSLLQDFGRNLQPDALRKVASSIAPDSAATAYSALILGTQDNQYDNRQPSIPYSQFVAYKPTMNKYDVAKTILQGDQLINPTKAQKDAGISPVKLPSDDKLKQTFDDAVGSSFSHNPQARQMAWSIYKSAYAGLAYTNGDNDGVNTKSVDSDLAEKAVQMATGGVLKSFNGGDVVMPFGMDKSTFKDRYTAAAGEALKAAGLNPAGQSNFIPVNVGDSQYRLVTGSGRWATNPRTGAPITVRVQ